MPPEHSRGQQLMSGPPVILPPPVLNAKVSTPHNSFALVMVGLLVAAAIVAHGYLSRPAPAPSPSPAPAFDAKAEGRAFGIDRAHNHAAGLNAAAAAIRSKVTIAEAQAKFQKDLSAADDAAFAKRFAAHLEAIVPAGQEPADDAKRAQYSDALEAIAGGEAALK